jgi:hypothetical protein
MGVDLIYPNINLLQYNLRDGLGDNEQNILARSASFYRKFLPEGKDLTPYRDREQADREFNQLLYTDLTAFPYQLLPKPFDGFYYPVQLGDTYALQLNYSGRLVNGKPNRQPQDYETAVKNLLDLAKNLLPQLDANSFGQTYLLTAFVEDHQVDKLEKIAISFDNQIIRSCAHQITSKNSADLARSISRGKWLGGDLFEFWTPPQSWQGDDFQKIIEHYPHTIVWLFPSTKLNEIDSKTIPDTYQDWIKLLHYRHKIFYAYYQSQRLKQQLKSANIAITKIATRLKTENSSLHHLQRLLFDTLAEFQCYGENVQALADQQQTIESNRDNYRSRCEAMIAKDPNHSLQFLLEFETKYGNKYQRQITADRAHLDSGLKVLENLSHTIQGTIQIEQTKSDRTTNILIASVGSGLAISQVVCSILIDQNPPAKDTSFYQTPAFQTSLFFGAIPSLLLLLFLAWVKVRNKP